jgi:hypothetical protein
MNMNMHYQRFDRAVVTGRDYIGSWAIVLRFVAGLKSNADFGAFCDEPRDPSCGQLRQSVVLSGSTSDKHGRSKSNHGKRAGSLSLKRPNGGSQAADPGRVKRSQNSIHTIGVTR